MLAGGFRKNGRLFAGPVPVAIYNPHLPADSVQRFDEQAVRAGALGVLKGDEFIKRMLGR